MSQIPVIVRSPNDLKKARELLGLSADGLARMLRVDDGRSIRRWEAGDSAIPGPVTVILETAMKYLAERALISKQLAMLRSGDMRTRTNNKDSTSTTITRLVKADADYEAALSALLKSTDSRVERLTRQTPESGTATEVRWYHLWRQTPKHSHSEKDDWSTPGELSPEAALAYFEKHEGFTGGLELCDDVIAEFILYKHEQIRTLRGNSVSIRSGNLIDSFSVRQRQPVAKNQLTTKRITPPPFRPILLNASAPGSGRVRHELLSLSSANEYVSHYVNNEQKAELHWIVAMAALKNALDTGAGFTHARAAMVEALACEGWLRH